jgi:phenylacetate-CoA ligase
MTVVAPTDTMQAIRVRVGELLEQEHWPRERLLAHQGERLQALLRHACERSSYYREVLGPGPTDTDLATVPTLPKSLLMEQFDRIVTDPRVRRRDVEAFVAEGRLGDLHEGRYRVFATSGSTGAQGIFVYAPHEFAEWIALGLSRLARLGVSAQTRLVSIGAPGDAQITKQLFAAFSAGREGVPRVTVATPLPETVATLNAYQPEAVIAYASVLGMLADEQLEGRLRIEPRLTMSTSEVLTDDVADRVTRAWGAAPINAYAATEAPGIAVAMPEQVGMHVWEESVVLEVVDDAGRPVPPGRPGSKVLLTNLVNRTQPLIRYELLDSVVVAEGEDPTGRPYMHLARVDGRSDDILELPVRGGRTTCVHPFHLRAPFVRLHDVHRYQIVHRTDGLLVRIVPRTGSERNLAERVRAALAGALADVGADVPVRVELVRDIEREPGHAAKMKLVVSEVPATSGTRG